MNKEHFSKAGFNPSRIVESFNVEVPVGQPVGKLTESNGSDNLPDYIIPKIEAIHEGATRNHVRYPAERLRGDREKRSGVYSWVHPYGKPVIYDHDTRTRATGRIEEAYFSETTSKGKPGIVVMPKITDKEAIQAIKDGRLLTVSIGGSTDSLTCSHCGTDIANEEFCGHYKGEKVEGKVVEWIVGDIYFDELSWVNVPASTQAMIIDKGDFSVAVNESFDGSKTKITEGDDSEMENKIAEMQKELDKIKAENDELKKQTEEQEKETTELEKDTAETEVVEEDKESNTQEENKQEETQLLEDRVKELEEENEKLKKQIEEQEEELEASKQEVSEATKTVESLQKEIKEELVTRVLDMKEGLGLMLDEAKEEEKSKLMSRTTESLKDNLQDLEESLIKKAKVGFVEGTAIQFPGQMGVVDIEEKKEVGVQGAIVALLGGKVK